MRIGGMLTARMVVVVATLALVEDDPPEGVGAGVGTHVRASTSAFSQASAVNT